MTKPIEAPTTQAHPATFPWMPILILGFAWFLAVAVELSPAGLLGAISADLGISAAAVGTLTSVYALGNALLVLPLTSFALRFSRRSALNVVMVVFVASNVLVAVAPSLLVADAGRFVGGACYALICTLFPAVAVLIAGREHAGRALTVLFASTSLGTALGAPLASLTGDAFGWRPVFIGAAVLAGIAGILMSFIVPAVREGHTDKLSLRQTIVLPGVFRVAMGWALVMLANFIVLTYIDAYLDNLGMPAYLTGITLFVIGISGLIGVILIGQISRRSLYTALVASPVVVAVGFIVLFFSNGILPLIFAGVALSGLGIAAAVVVYQQTILLTGKRAPETATSVAVVLVQAGFAVGAAVGGITLELFGVATIPLVALVFTIGSIIIAISLRRTVRHSTPAPASDPRTTELTRDGN